MELIDESISLPMITALDQVWRAVRRRHSDVPPVVITLGSGTLGVPAGSTRLGHFAAARWQHGEHALAELFVGGEGLQRGASSVLGTLLHEAAHGMAYVRQIQDTSRQGRYHNARFRVLAEEIGIVVEHDSRLGWSSTSVPAETAQHYTADLDALDDALTAWRHSELRGSSRGGGVAGGKGGGGASGGGGGRSSNNNPTAYVCGCAPGRRIRVATSTAACGPILCGLCGKEFTAAG